jgi:class 3 adenylate cyclase
VYADAWLLVKKKSIVPRQGGRRTMTERQNRTIICSVLFLDLVEYSRKPVAEQMRLKERFNLLLRSALKSVAQSDRIVLDTGDGAAVTLLGDPEDALFMALELRDGLVAQPIDEARELKLRSGINLGPVKLVRDINGRPNIIGDGINVAQRIMGFAQPGQVLVSRSYYEIVSRLSDDYAELFCDQGVRTDKHVREHHVYGVSGDRPTPARTSSEPPSRWLAQFGKPGELLPQLAELAERLIRNLLGKPRVTSAIAAAVILGLGGMVRASRDAPPAPVAATMKGTGAQQAAVVVPAQTTPAAVVPAEEKATAVEKPVAPQDPADKAGKSTGPKKLAALKPAKGSTPGSEQDSLVTVSLAVSPWGEVYVDGKHQGVTPPIRSISVAPGRHEIEFRNTTFPTYVQVLDVKTGDRPTLRHKFQGSETR